MEAREHLHSEVVGCELGELTGNSYLTVDLSKLGHNIRQIRAHIGEHVKLLPVLKGSTSGHGLEEIAHYLTEACCVDMLCVGHTVEAERLRSSGINCDILVLGGTPFNNIPYVVSHDLTTTLASAEYAEQLSREAVKHGRTVRVHVKVNTGLERIGARPGAELDALLTQLSTLPNIVIEGAYTHFATATEEDVSFVHRQAARFDEALAQFEQHGIALKYRHACNSSGTARFPEYHYNMVRSMMLQIGYDDVPNSTNQLDLKTLVTWKAFVTQVNRIKAGTRFDYYQALHAEKDMKVAIGSFGYADGYPDDVVGNGGYVMIHGKRAEILSLNMDQVFLDVTDIDDVQINDEILLLGKSGDAEITLHDIAQHTHRSELCILNTIGPRVRRVYIR